MHRQTDVVDGRADRDRLFDMTVTDTSKRSIKIKKKHTETIDTFIKPSYSVAELKDEIDYRFKRVESPNLKNILKNIVFDAKKTIYKTEMDKKLKMVYEIKEKRPLAILSSKEKKKLTTPKMTPKKELHFLYYQFLIRKGKERMSTEDETFGETEKFSASNFKRNQSIENVANQTVGPSWGFNSTNKKVFSNSNLFRVKCHITKNKNMSSSASKTASTQFKTKSKPLLKNQIDFSAIGSKIEKGLKDESLLRQLPEYKCRVEAMASQLRKGFVQ